MIFNSLMFVLMFPLVCAFYYALPQRWRNMYLLIVSIIFYLMWNVVFGFFLLWIIVASYGFALYAERTKAMPHWIGIVVTLLPLAFFKYYGFACDIASDILNNIGIVMQPNRTNLAVPVGISFYTFQALGYLMDVGKGKIRAEHNLLHHALFISFFPQILSGPISRYHELMPQIKAVRSFFNRSLAVTGLYRMVWGMFLKVAVADRFAIFVDTVFTKQEEFNGITLLFATFCYAIQILTDFSGYSLLAIGCANVMGFEIHDNFRRPYFSAGFGEFWRRWHITLSLWLRDYVYIALGGNRAAVWRVRFNLMITFLVSGLWHGAAYTYVVWGLIHGLMVVIDREWKPFKHQWAQWIGIPVTFFMASLLWLFFRLPALSDVWYTISKIFTDFSLQLQIPDNRDMKATLLTMCIMFAVMLAKDIRDEWAPERLKGRKTRLAGAFAVVLMILMFGVFDAGQFIYISF